MDNPEFCVMMTYGIPVGPDHPGDSVPIRIPDAGFNLSHHRLAYRGVHRGWIVVASGAGLIGYRCRAWKML
jgi:hypothetical protein